MRQFAWVSLRLVMRDHRIGMHLGHVGAPQHHGVGVLDVVIVAGRLVGAEHAVERRHCRGHAVARVGVEVVGTETGLEQLVHGVAFVDGPLPGTEHRHSARPLFRVGLAELALHLVEGLLPGHRHELALLVELAVLHPQQGLRQAVLAVEDLAVEVALDAVQSLVHRRSRVALGGDDAAVLGGHHDAAAGTAEAAHRLVPLPVLFQFGGGGFGQFRDRQSHHRCRAGGNAGLDEFATG